MGQLLDFVCRRGVWMLVVASVLATLMIDSRDRGDSQSLALESEASAAPASVLSDRTDSGASGRVSASAGSDSDLGSMHGPEASMLSEANPLPPLAQRRLVSFIAERYGVEQPDARSFVALASRVGQEVLLDPLLLLAVIAVESRFDPFAQSRRGAQGLMQIRTHLHVQRFERFGGREAAFDPAANVRVGAELLKDMLSREGSTAAALKAYVGAANRPHDSGYGARVLETRALLAEAATGAAPLALLSGDRSTNGPGRGALF